MASVAKLSRDRRKKGAPYYIQFLDHQGKRRTTKGCSDKGVSEAKAAKIETVVERIKLGLCDVAELDELLGRPQSVAWDSQLKEFEASLKHKNNTAKHVKLTINRIKVVLNGCKFVSLADFDGDAVETFLTQHCQEEDIGHRTYNHLSASGRLVRLLTGVSQTPGAGAQSLRRHSASQCGNRRSARPAGAIAR